MWNSVKAILVVSLALPMLGLVLGALVSVRAPDVERTPILFEPSPSGSPHSPEPTAPSTALPDEPDTTRAPVSPQVTDPRGPVVISPKPDLDDDDDDERDDEWDDQLDDEGDSDQDDDPNDDDTDDDRDD